MSMIGDNAAEVEPVDTENIGSLARLVLSELPACDDLMVRQQLGFALREFCRETDACTVTFRAKYGLHHAIPVACAPNGMEVVSVLDVKRDGRDVRFVVEDTIPPRVRVHDCYDVCEWFDVRFSVAPKAGGEDCPRWFKERYAEAIVAGAMFHLLSMSGKGWSDPQRAAQYGGKYQQWIAEATYRRMNGSAVESGPMSAVPSGGLFM